MHIKRSRLIGHCCSAIVTGATDCRGWGYPKNALSA
jgi:hypothetical protein